ncbi:MAG: MATE family efflux transporter [Candidatus Limivicinus sp.]
MTSGPIYSQLVTYAVTLSIGMLFQQLYNTVDTIVVGRFVGKEALAAVGSTASIINMLVGLGAGLATGASVVVSQCYGAHDNEKLSKAVHTTMAGAFIMSVAGTILGLFIVDPMLRLMKTPADVMDSARQYLSIFFSGLSGLFIYNIGSGILRAVGDARRPIYFLCFSALLNIVFDLLFVIAFHMGVAGVAFATILAQGLSAVLVMIVLTKDKAAYGIRWKKIRLDSHMLRRILNIGLPSAIQQAITSFSNVFVQSYINFFGSACMAGWTSYNKIDIFILIPLQAISMASTTFVGQNFGAEQIDRAKEGARKSLRMSLVITSLLVVVVMLLSPYLCRLFTADEEVIAYGVHFLRIIAPFYIICCFNQIYAGALRGVGNANVPTIIMLFSFVLFRQIYLYIVKQLGNNFNLISIAYPMGWIVCSILMSILYHNSIMGTKKHRDAPEE